jgi:hypothetical protein
MVIKEPASGAVDVDPQAALHALKVKARVGRRGRLKRDAAAFTVPLDATGNVHHTQDQFVNEQELASHIKVEQVTVSTLLTLFQSCPRCQERKFIAR